MSASIVSRTALALSTTALLAFSSSALAGSPATFTSHCSATVDGVSIWVGHTTDSNDNTTWYRAETAKLGQVTRTALLFTDSSDTCALNPQTSDAGLNPQTSDAGLVADLFSDLVVLNLVDYGEPLGVVAVFNTGRIDVNLARASANQAKRLLEEQQRTEQAALIYQLLESGALKTTMSGIF